MFRKNEKSFFKNLRKATAEFNAEIKACKALETSEPSENDIVIKTYDINQDLLKLDKSVDDLRDKVHNKNTQLQSFHGDFQNLLFEIEEDTNMLEDFLKHHGYEPVVSSELISLPIQNVHAEEIVQTNKEVDYDSDSSQRGSVTPVFISNYEKQRKQREKEKQNMAFENFAGSSSQPSKQSTTPVLAPLNHPKIIEDIASVSKKLEIESDEELEELGKQLDRRVEERKALHSAYVEEDTLMASPALNFKHR